MKLKIMLISLALIIFCTNYAYADTRTVANFTSLNIAGTYTIIINGGQTQNF